METSESCRIHNLSKKCKEKISLLEAEIEELERKVDQQKHVVLGKTSLDKDLMRKCSVICSDSSGKTADGVKSEIDALQEKIKLMQKITGIAVDEATWKIIHEDGSIVTRQHTVEGSVCDTPFILQFTVKEDFASSDSAPVLSELVCMIVDKIVKFLEEPLDRIVEATEIQGFFMIMTSYMKWYEEKERTLKHFIDKYPAVVSIHGDTFCELQIKTKQTRSAVFLLNWDLTVNTCHHVERRLTLSVKAPHKMIKVDKDKTLASAPHMFSSMVEKLGVERALHCLIELVQGK